MGSVSCLNWEFLTFIAQCAEQIAQPGRASWISRHREHVPECDTLANGQTVLQYIQSHPDLPDTLEHGQHVELSDGAGASRTPAFIFPLHDGSRLVALLSVRFPPRARPSRAALSRVQRLCDAAVPLLAALAADGQNDDQFKLSGSPESRVHLMEEALRELTHANRQLDALAQVRSHAVRNAVHDLRTPLVAVHGYARLMLREQAGPLTGVQREYLGTMQENTARMICELHELSEEFDKNEPVQFTSLDLTSVWPDLLARIQAQTGEMPVRIQARFTKRPFPITADAALLAQALGTLIPYVLRRTAKGGLVQVSFDKGDDIVIRITTDDAYRLAKDKPGAGTRSQFDELSAAQRAVRLHGGGISVRGNGSKALTVTVTLPVICLKEHSDSEDVDEQAFGSCSG